MTLPTSTLPTLAGMPLDEDEVRILALSEECDRLREWFLLFAGHKPGCGFRTSTDCECGFDGVWRKMFGAPKGVDSAP